MRQHPARYSLEEFENLSIDEQMDEYQRVRDYYHNPGLYRRIMRVYRKYMNNPYGIHTFYSIEQAKSTTHKVGGYWVPVRPIRYPSLWNDFKLAWLVFTRQCDAFGWPEDDWIQLCDSDVFKPKDVSSDNEQRRT